jgi:hypothetical protein
MAELSFGVSGPNMLFSVTMQLSDTDTPRILSYLMASQEYGQVITLDENQQQRASQATPEQAAQNFAAATLKRLLADTVRHEKELAMKTAAEAVKAINPTGD